jgi:transcriptional regulator with XRE-family HTH domain
MSQCDRGDRASIAVARRAAGRTAPPGERLEGTLGFLLFGRLPEGVGLIAVVLALNIFPWQYSGPRRATNSAQSPLHGSQSLLPQLKLRTVTAGVPPAEGTDAAMVGKSKVKGTTSDDVEVGQRIRARRMANGMSQSELGELLGVTFQQVQKYEKGVNRVGAGRLVRVAEALDVPVSFFFGGTDIESSDTRAILGFLDTSYALRLLRAFSRIPQSEIQRAVVDLVESIAPPSAEDRL